jgi:lipoprotein-anchoring transpeptidase ErfK/SrfK
MKKYSSIPLILSIFILALISSFVQPVSAQSEDTQPAGAGDMALCVPGVAQFESLNCLNAGPAKTLSDYEKLGLTFPAEAVAIAHPSTDLFNVQFAYAEVTTGAANLYASVEDGMKNNANGVLPAGRIKYIAWTQRQVTDNGTFYQIATGAWINGNDITKRSIPYFQGYLVKQYPNAPFGWIKTNDAKSHTAPDYNAPLTNKTYTRMDLIHRYDSKTVDGTEWIMIGPDEWIEHQYVGIVYNNNTAPQGVTTNRWIEVNLYEQVLTVYDQGKMVFTTLISSGVEPFYTQPGTFQIYKKIDHEYMTGAFEADRSDYYYLEEVPFIMYYDQSRALHGAYWNTFFGYQRSHGCVNLSVGDAHWLYDWASEGDTVYVWDPSGQTPTDPSLYGAGGV